MALRQLFPSWLTVAILKVTILHILLLLAGLAQATELRRINDTKGRDKALGELLEDPWALLYTDKGTSDFTTYDYQRSTRKDQTDFSRGCHNVPRGDQGWTSVYTFITCVRVFSDYDCWGQSLAIYPREAQPTAQTPIPRSVSNPRFQKGKSIGPCLRNEFDSAAIYQLSKHNHFARKDFSESSERITIPDLIESELQPDFNKSHCHEYAGDFRGNFSFESCLKRDGDDGSLRVWKLRARLNTSTVPASPELAPSKTLTQKWEEMDKKDGDVMGFFIPPYLSDAAYTVHNVFPLSRQSKKQWDDVLEAVYNLTSFNERQNEREKHDPYPDRYRILDFECKIDVMTQFYYKNESKTGSRPDGLYYRIEYTECKDYCQVAQCNYYPLFPENRKITYGFLWN